MDDFSIDRPELSGSLIQLEFGKGGRIRQLWVTDPSRPENGDNFQFILPSLSFGEEMSEDYLPGTILLGARTSPDDPWILSRNSSARNLNREADDDDEDDDELRLRDSDLTTTSMAYDFPLLPEIEATSKFTERTDPMPHVVWDIEITNRGTGGLEIGELGFPMAFNNLYEGVARSPQGIEELWNERMAIHKFIGGAASYLHVQRLLGEPPGLIVVPGENTSWEFYTHVPASLSTGFRWEGIPIVYIHSKAAVDREKWPQWIHGHSSITLEQGETRKYQLKFLPTERDRDGGFQSTLQTFGHPVMRLWPSAVGPVEVGLTVEVGGATPTQFVSDVDAELETDSFEGGGSCSVKAGAAGPLTLTFEDTLGRTSHAHLLFTEPIEDLIRRRAEWIVENQICQEASNLQGAILNTDMQVGLQMTDPDEYQRPFGVVCSLGDALFLAEKNRLEPHEDQIEALDRYVEEFLLDDLQNPHTMVVGHSFLDTKAVAIGNEAFPAALAARLLETMGDIAESAGGVSRTAAWYRDRAGETDAKSLEGRLRPRPDYWISDELFTGSEEEAIDDYDVPVWNPYEWDANSFWPAYRAALHQGRLEGLVRLVTAMKAPTPSWWWYGSDKRFLKDEEIPHPAMLDKGEMCLGSTTMMNSLLILRAAEERPNAVSDWMVRMAHGGLLGVWALVRPDGAAAMAYCPDISSRQYGMSWFTGDIGVSLWTYLRTSASHVYPLGPGGVAAFGCTCEAREDGDREYIRIRPWEGVGRKIVIHEWNVSVECEYGRIEEFEFDTRLRHATLTLKNDGDRKRKAAVTVSGLWGTKIKGFAGSEASEVGEPIMIEMGVGETLHFELEATQ